MSLVSFTARTDTNWSVSSGANVLLATTLTLLLFSAAGIPPLVGFFAKYQVITSALSSGFFYISLVTILASLISSVYYLRVIRAI
jgi:NADH:ubiquinone oxidoreductase subunit 2 (subunit N)